MKRKISRLKPTGHPNGWPIGDYTAFVELIDLAGKAMRPPEEGEEAADVILEAVLTAARDVGLPKKHWLVVDVLESCFGIFPIHGGRYVAVDARSYFRNATPEDLCRAPADRLTWALKLLEAEPSGEAK